MVLCEDGECSVCLLPYSRVERIPRVLHCRHTFCDSCLERMSTERNGLLTVGCPLCRRVTCIGRGRGLREALWVNSKLWDQIPEDVDVREEEEEEDGEKQTAAQERIEDKQLQGEWWVYHFESLNITTWKLRTVNVLNGRKWEQNLFGGSAEYKIPVIPSHLHISAEQSICPHSFSLAPRLYSILPKAQSDTRVFSLFSISSRSSRAKLKLPTFFRRFSLTKQHQERIVSGSNVYVLSL